MICVRPAREEECDLLAEIERECFDDSPWLPADFKGYTNLIAEFDKTPAGFLVVHDVFSGAEGEPREREILNLAVLPRYRRLGVARALLSAEMVYPATYYLDVRESNLAAQELYKSFGFVEISRRKHYYRFPDETAIVMKAVINEPSFL